jgi:glycosyltransferase involved in cell wall biosynthesis
MISTNTGVRGYELRAGEDFIAAETADEFATAIVDVLRAPAKFDARAAAARRRVEALDWTRIGERFADLACSLVSR